jgi:hypothetical protein
VNRLLPRLAALIIGFGAVLVPASSAHATIHEIVAAWCSGHGALEPSGIGGGSHADNFAQPVISSGFVAGVVPFQDGFLLQFNYGNPNAKVVGTGQFVVIGQVNGKPLYVELIQPNPDFPAFQNCPNLMAG